MYVAEHRPVLESPLVLSFCLIVGEFQFVVSRLFVVGVARIASLEMLFQVADGDELAPRRYMIDFAGKAHFLSVKGVCVAKLYAIEWLSSWTKGFPDLRKTC